MRRLRKPTKPASEYSVEEIRQTPTYLNIKDVLTSMPDAEIIRLARTELAYHWADITREKVNKLCDQFRAALSRLGVEGKTVSLTLVADDRGNYYYDVRAEKGGRKHSDREKLPSGSLKVTTLKD